METNPHFICNGIVYTVDPLKKFSHVDPEALVNELGFIPTFITEETDNVMEEALLRYGFGMGEMTGGVVEEDGTYKYPGDPDLYPLTRCKANDTVIFIYSYGIIAFVDKDTTTVHRFD